MLSLTDLTSITDNTLDFKSLQLKSSSAKDRLLSKSVAARKVQLSKALGLTTFLILIFLNYT